LALHFITPAFWTVNYLVAHSAQGSDPASCAGVVALVDSKDGAATTERYI
jgi:hypothetical protein